MSSDQMLSADTAGEIVEACVRLLNSTFGGGVSIRNNGMRAFKQRYQRFLHECTARHVCFRRENATNEERKNTLRFVGVLFIAHSIQSVKPLTSKNYMAEYNRTASCLAARIYWRDEGIVSSETLDQSIEYAREMFKRVTTTFPGDISVEEMIEYISKHIEPKRDWCGLRYSEIKSA